MNKGGIAARFHLDQVSLYFDGVHAYCYLSIKAPERFGYSVILVIKKAQPLPPKQYSAHSRHSQKLAWIYTLCLFKYTSFSCAFS